MKINIKPLSVNKCWQGRRFKTNDYKVYEKELLYLLPNSISINKQSHILLCIELGLSNKLQDIDNVLKPFLDILQKKYDFNDNMIYSILIEKKIVPKEDEYIDFEIKQKNGTKNNKDS